MLLLKIVQTNFEIYMKKNNIKTDSFLMRFIYKVGVKNIIILGYFTVVFLV